MMDPAPKDATAALAAPILHLITPLPHVSPFDVNMAVDAGYVHLAPYTHVRLGEVRDLTQDMMFSRPPQAAARTGLFIGGKDVSLALDMQEAARKTLFAPFEISLFADPAGAFTTAAAMIALVERALARVRPGGLRGAAVQIYGATGAVGGMAGVIAAQAGADVTLVSHRDLDAMSRKADEFIHRFDLDFTCAVARNDREKEDLLADAEVVLATGPAGVAILSAAHLAAARGLKVAADVNAVPPAGIAPLTAHDDEAPLACGVGIGALTIGNLKYRVQHALLRQMHEATAALHLGLDEAFALARQLAG